MFWLINPKENKFMKIAIEQLAEFLNKANKNTYIINILANKNR